MAGTRSRSPACGCGPPFSQRPLISNVLGVEHGEAAGAVALGVAEHADHDVLARHAVDGVRARVAGLGDELLGLDHLLDPGRPRVVGDVDDVDPRGAEARHDQVRAIRARGRPSCSGSSRSGAARRRRWASASRARSVPRPRPRRRGSPAARRRYPYADTRRTGTPPRARASPPRATRKRTTPWPLRLLWAGVSDGRNPSFPEPCVDLSNLRL